MADPKFATREELEAWIAQRQLGANNLNNAGQLALLAIVRRVTLAHGHLFEDHPNDR